MMPNETKLKKRVSLPGFILSTMTIVLVVSTVILSIVTIVTRSIEFHKDVRRELDTYIASETEKLRSRAQIALNMIRYEQTNQDSALRNLLRQEVNEAFTLGKALEAQFKHLPQDKRLKLIVESIRTKRFNGSRGYFFMTRYDGVELLFADRSELEGKNLINMKSSDGKMVIQEMIRLVQSPPAEGFYSYNWSKPGVSGDHHKKISFVKAFPPYDCFIGTGEYVEDFEESRKTAILQLLSSMNDSSGGYIFAGTWDGISLIGPAVGKNMWEAEDIDGLKVVQNLVRVAKNGGGTLKYSLPQETGLPPSRKMSYVLAVPEWEWYIGTGVSIDAIETELAQRKKQHIFGLVYSLLVNLIVMVILILALRRFLHHFFQKIDTDIRNLNQFLSQSVSDSPDSIAENLTFSEFSIIANCADKMILHRDSIQSQLHQSQKMKAIGQLAGGVAHDFNNNLAAIIGASELMLGAENLTDKQRKYLNMTLAAAERAASSTKKLLVFSRRGQEASSPVDCLTIAEETVELLRQTVDKAITISLDNRALQSVVIGDESELQSALMNIGINAAQAMPDGGELSYTLENLDLDEEYCHASPFAIKPGMFLKITVQDNGCGIPPELAARIFEPFFTTKEQGKGTGLGLALVYGTIQKHGGAVTVYSEVGSGTVFHLYLPLTNERACPKSEAPPILQGRGTVLVVDDEELIRNTAAALLESLGYQVILATNGQEGVDTFRKAKDEINLVILDMIMPVMGGHEAFTQLRQIDPSIPVLIASGFAKEEDMAKLKEQGANGFLNKPFNKAKLMEMLQIVQRHNIE